MENEAKYVFLIPQNLNFSKLEPRLEKQKKPILRLSVTGWRLV